MPPSLYRSLTANSRAEMPIFSCLPLTWGGRAQLQPQHQAMVRACPTEPEIPAGMTGMDSSGTQSLWEGALLEGQISEYKTRGASFNDGEQEQHLLGHSREPS